MGTQLAWHTWITGMAAPWWAVETCFSKLADYGHDWSSFSSLFLSLSHFLSLLSLYHSLCHSFKYGLLSIPSFA